MESRSLSSMGLTADGCLGTYLADDAQGLQRMGAVYAVRQGVRQQLVEEHAHGVDVAAQVNLLDPAHRLFGAHVGGRAHHLARLGHLAVLHPRVVSQPGQAEVQQPRVALAVNQDVGRLQVPVDDAALVGKGHGPGDLYHQAADGALVQSIPGHVLPDVAALHVLHAEVRLAVHLAVLEDGNDPRVLEPRDGLRLALEPDAVLLGGEPAAEHDLQHDNAFRLPLLGLVDRPHAAVPDGSEHLIAVSELGLHRTQPRLLKVSRRADPQGVALEVGRLVRGLLFWSCSGPLPPEDASRPCGMRTCTRRLHLPHITTVAPGGKVRSAPQPGQVTVSRMRRLNSLRQCSQWTSSEASPTSSSVSQ